ncbi:MAG: peroxide stress protein YaaA, partial [Selenomonadaceae bacterium]|nr:peroxide stress protein YaaA [Selenomonadaceae bacterium]
MKIILSPAKKMNVDTDSLLPLSVPVFLESTKEIAAWLKGKSYLELKKLWCCNDKIAGLNFRRLETLDLTKNLTPAV